MRFESKQLAAVPSCGLSFALRSWHSNCFVLSFKGEKVVRNFEAGTDKTYDDPGVVAYDRVDGPMVDYHKQASQP